MRHNFFLLFSAILFKLGITVSTSDAYAEQLRKSGGSGREVAEIHVQMGQRYLEQGELKLAMEKLQKALKYDAKFPDAHTVIAVLYERINDSKNAELHYKRAVELNPKNGEANNNYGTFLCKQGKYELAQKHFDRAVSDPFYPTPGIVLVNAGSCLLAAGNLEKAETNFRQALKLIPNNSNALIQLTTVLVKKQDYFRARAFMQRYESLEAPLTAESLDLGREIELKLGNTETANRYTEKLLEKFPDSVQAHALKPRS